jgi:hypothetical protein
MSVIERVLGWESTPVTTFPGPADVVPAPQPRPSPLSLVSTCKASGALFTTADRAPFVGDDPDTPSTVLQGPDLSRWVNGFQFLRELAGPAAGYAWCQAAPMANEVNCDGPTVVSVFEAVMLDDRSTLGWKASDARDRVLRGLLAHEAWRVENEWWTGALNPDNPHLAQANAFCPISAQADVAGDTATGLANSLGLLEQSLANSDAGQGIIHCTPYVFNAWATRGGIPFRYDGATPGSSTRIWTPNGNLVVPGYGYDGTGPSNFYADDPDSQPTQWSTEQWAYATDMVDLLQAPVIIEPEGYEDMSPAIPVYNDIPWRATRPWAIFSNGWLRAAVLVDTTTI